MSATDQMGDPDWCYEHGRVEKHIEPYRQCSECGHTYPTPDSLSQDFMTEGGAGALVPADQIFSCAHCAHDF